MAIRLLLSISLILIFGAAIKAQTIRGKIVDDKQQPIDGATVILQTRDSIYIDAVISNADGSFLFNHHPEEYCLIIQHLLYHTRKLADKNVNAGIIQLESKNHALEEVIIKAERPFVRVEGGCLQYNLGQLAGNKVVK